MVLIVLEKVPAGLKGELSRWMMEIKSGVFLGKLSAMVREEIWGICTRKMGNGGFFFIHNWNNEQGFLIRTAGNVSREIIDFDGLQLVRKPS